MIGASLSVPCSQGTAAVGLLIFLHTAIAFTSGHSQDMHSTGLGNPHLAPFVKRSDSHLAAFDFPLEESRRRNDSRSTSSVSSPPSSIFHKSWKYRNTDTARSRVQHIPKQQESPLTPVRGSNTKNVDLTKLLGKDMVKESGEARSYNFPESQATEASHDLSASNYGLQSNDTDKKLSTTLPKMDDTLSTIPGTITEMDKAESIPRIVIRFLRKRRIAEVKQHVEPKINKYSLKTESDKTQSPTKERRLERKERNAGTEKDDRYKYQPFNINNMMSTREKHENLDEDSFPSVTFDRTGNLHEKSYPSVTFDRAAQFFDSTKRSEPKSADSSISNQPVIGGTDSSTGARQFRVKLILTPRMRRPAFITPLMSLFSSYQQKRSVDQSELRPNRFRSSSTEFTFPLTLDSLRWILRSLKTLPGLPTPEFSSPASELERLDYYPLDDAPPPPPPPPFSRPLSPLRRITTRPGVYDQVVSRFPAAFNGKVKATRHGDGRSVFSKRTNHRARCDSRRINVRNLMEFFMTGKICGSSIVRLRYGLGRR